MSGIAPFRNLHSVMIVTLHVAVTTYAVRSFSRSESLASSFAIWVPLSILLALFLSMPIGRAITSAFEPTDWSTIRRCPLCPRGELRPLLRAGSGLFQPPAGYRCRTCRTTFRPVGEKVIEEPPPKVGASVDPEGIVFLGAPRDEPVDDREIRFLDEPGANIPGPPVSEV